jgi:hypothetical protein
VRSPWPSLVILLAAVLGCHVADSDGDDDPGTGAPVAYGGPVSEWPAGDPKGTGPADAGAAEAPQASGATTSAGSGTAPATVADAAAVAISPPARDAGAPFSGSGDAGLDGLPADAQTPDGGCAPDADAGADATVGNGTCGDAVVNCILSFGSACNPA